MESVTVRLHHDKICAADCEPCETNTGNIDRVEKEVELVGDLDAQQRQKLLDIADRCSVNRTCSQTEF